MTTKPRIKTIMLSLNDRVTYTDLNLRHWKGVIVEIGKFAHGADCVIHWLTPYSMRSSECLRNLTKIESSQ